VLEQAIAVTAGRAASTAAASTVGVASTAEVVSSTVAVSLSVGRVSSTASSSDAAISVTAADLNAAACTKLTSRRSALDTYRTPFLGFAALTITPTDRPVRSSSEASMSASVPRDDFEILNDA